MPDDLFASVRIRNDIMKSINSPSHQYWPKISIITPSLNQDRYLDACIRSIIEQVYPNYEYLIMDGGSTDDSVEIIRNYESWLTDWVSEKDMGQSDAINKGFARCDGEILCWLCADDMLAPNALRTVGEIFRKRPGIDVVAGSCCCLYEDHPEQTMIRSNGGSKWLSTPYLGGIWQPACFFRRRALHRVPVTCSNLHYCMDRELWCHLVAHGARWWFSDEVLGTYRYTGKNKSMIGGEAIINEIAEIFAEYYPIYRALPDTLKNNWLSNAVTATLTESGFAGRFRARVMSKVLTASLLTRFPHHHVRALQHELFSYRFWNSNHHCNSLASN